MSDPIHELRLTSPTTILVDGVEYPCRIGREGIAPPGEKREGDLKTPTGKFPIRCCYYRPDRVLPPPKSALPLIALTPEDAWCDAPSHPRYNQFIKLPFSASHERLWREDAVYDLILPLGYNDGESGPIVPGAGSAIFMHLIREDGVGTEGCIAVERATLLDWISRLSSKSYLLITN